MANEPAAPAAPAPAPVAPPAAPAPKPVTPPLPKAQTDSITPKAPVTPRELPKPPPTLTDSVKKVSADIFKEETPVAPTPDKPVAQAVVPPAPDTPVKPAPPAAAAEKDPFDGMELPANASEAQKSNFKKMREAAASEVNRLKNEHASLAKELATYKNATPADQADMTKLKTELAQVRDRLAVYDVSSHPDFQREYAEPKKKALDEAKMLGGDYNIPSGDVEALLSLPRKEFAEKISAMVKDMPTFDQASFVTAMRTAAQLQVREKDALSKAGELKQQLQAKAAQEARVAFEASRNEFTTKVPVMEIPEGAEPERVAEIRAYNQARDEAVAEAERFTFGQATERQVADMATQAAALKVVAKHLIPSLQRDLAKSNGLLQEALNKLAAIEAKKNPGSFAAPESDAVVDTSKMSIKDISKRVFGANPQ